MLGAFAPAPSSRRLRDELRWLALANVLQTNALARGSARPAARKPKLPKLPLMRYFALRAVTDRHRRGIMNPYGHSAARSVLRRCRAAELLPRRRAPRGDATRRQPPSASARVATRSEADRPLRPPRRADRGGMAALSKRPAPPPTRGAADRGRARRRGSPARHTRDRRVDRSGRSPRTSSALQVPARASRSPRRARDLRHTHGHRTRRRARARAGRRGSEAPAPLTRVRAARDRRDRARRAT